MNLFNRWKDKATEYIDVRVGLLKLSFIERTSMLLGNLMAFFIYLFVALAFFIFLGFAMLEAFSSMLNSRVEGAFMTAGFFGLMLGVLFAVRRSIITAFGNIFIRVLTADDDDDQEDRGSRKVKSEGE